ncbi:MAG: chemotaxis protein CheW [Proteobacteria bacterium]|nr:chemotaxis protein CheW [Pseudomonadota bacterium]MBU1584154.1 chemotaxis protein CheW [Pseudomonadota bacterium]MBU2456180.1 chemotaxis protein CheW [Pseudomonadota bacterium]MBU2629237.1 chemotaxis protein CheW [Pseudomonadota bacterium]
MEQSAQTMDQAIKTARIKTGKYLTFTLDDEEYGIGILKVKEIIGMMPITSVPRTPEFVKGVINLRGKVIPVMDLRIKFDMTAIPYTERTCIIVVEIDSEEGTVLIGIVVDSVSEVLNIQENEIEETPAFGTRLNTEYILGMAKTGGGVKILLYIEKVLSAQEIISLEKAAD